MDQDSLFQSCESALAYAKERLHADDYESAASLLNTALIRVRRLQSIVNVKLKHNEMSNLPFSGDLPCEKSPEPE